MTTIPPDSFRVYTAHVDGADLAEPLADLIVGVDQLVGSIEDDDAGAGREAIMLLVNARNRVVRLVAAQDPNAGPTDLPDPNLDNLEGPPIQGDAGVACPCGGRMLYQRPSDPASPVACPRCGRTPLDLVAKDGGE